MDLNKLDEKLEKLGDRLDSVDKTLISQHETLKNHIRRTEIAESRLNQFETIIQEKVLKHINQIDGALKLLGFLALITGLVYTVMQIFGKR